MKNEKRSPRREFYKQFFKFSFSIDNFDHPGHLLYGHHGVLHALCDLLLSGSIRPSAPPCHTTPRWDGEHLSNQLLRWQGLWEFPELSIHSSASQSSAQGCAATHSAPSLLFWQPANLWSATTVSWYTRGENYYGRVIFIFYWEQNLLITIRFKKLDKSISWKLAENLKLDGKSFCISPPYSTFKRVEAWEFKTVFATNSNVLNPYNFSI